MSALVGCPDAGLGNSYSRSGAVLALGPGLCYSGQHSGQQGCRVGPRPATTTPRGRPGACPGAGALTTPGSGADAPDDPHLPLAPTPAGARRRVHRRIHPGPAPPPSAADLRRQRVIRPLAPRPPEPAAPAPPGRDVIAPVTAGPPPGSRGGIIRRLERDPPGARQAGSIIRPLAPLPPNMPGSRDRKTGIIRRCCPCRRCPVRPRKN